VEAELLGRSRVPVKSRRKEENRLDGSDKVFFTDLAL
jgi:hypothetical protein